MKTSAVDALRIGLSLAGAAVERQPKGKLDTNVERFKALFGSEPVVLATIWDDIGLNGQSSRRTESALHLTPQQSRLTNECARLGHTTLMACPNGLGRPHKSSFETTWPRENTLASSLKSSTYQARATRCFRCASFASDSTRPSKTESTRTTWRRCRLVVDEMGGCLTLPIHYSPSLSSSLLITACYFVLSS